MPTLLDQVYLIKITSGIKSEIPASEVNLLVGVSGTTNFGFLSQSSGCLGTVIGGGHNNRTIANFATVVGGLGNSSSGYASIVGGGQSNIAWGQWSAINGGFNNRACGTYSSISAGNGNVTFGGYSFIGGGELNLMNSFSTSHAVIGGGCGNSALGDCSAVVGGRANIACELSFVGGGRSNCTEYASTIGGGCFNRSIAPISFIGGGFNNAILSSCANGNYTTCGVTIAGGWQNNAGGTNPFAPVNAEFSSIIGGRDNCAASSYTSILGGQNNCTFAPYGYVGGRCAVIQPNHSGAAVLGDGQNRPHLSSGPNTLTLDFASGVYVSGGLYLNGNQLLISAVGSVYSPTVTAG